MGRLTSFGFTAAAIACLLVLPALAQDEPEEMQTVTIQGTTTPCYFGAVVVEAMDGWFNLEIEDPPPGKRGCYFFRPGEEFVEGLIKLKSVEATLERYQKDPYAKLLEDGEAEFADMNIKVGPVLGKDEEVPTLERFSDGQFYHQEGVTKGLPDRTVWTVIFRDPGYFYVLTLISEGMEDASEQWEINKAAFQHVGRNLNMAGDRESEAADR